MGTHDPRMLPPQSVQISRPRATELCTELSQGLCPRSCVRLALEEIEGVVGGVGYEVTTIQRTAGVTVMLWVRQYKRTRSGMQEARSSGHGARFRRAICNRACAPLRGAEVGPRGIPRSPE